MTEQESLIFDQKIANQEAPVIRLKAVFKGGKHIVQPAFDPDRGYYAGVARLSPEDKRQLAYYVEPEVTKLTLRDGTEFDLSNEIEATNWEWVKRLRIIAGSHEEAQMSEEAMFYVHIEGREAAKSISRHTRIFEAQKYVFEDNPDNYMDRALILGQDFTGEHPNNIKEWLITRAKDKPEEIINLYNAKNTGIQLLYLKAKQMEFIKENAEGVIKYENKILGLGDEGALAYLMSKDGREIYELIQRRVYPEYATTEVTNTSTPDGKDETIEGTEENTVRSENNIVNELLNGSKD